MHVMAPVAVLYRAQNREDSGPKLGHENFHAEQAGGCA